MTHEDATTYVESVQKALPEGWIAEAISPPGFDEFAVQVTQGDQICFVLADAFEVMAFSTLCRDLADQAVSRLEEAALADAGLR